MYKLPALELLPAAEGGHAEYRGSCRAAHDLDDPVMFHRYLLPMMNALLRFLIKLPVGILNCVQKHLLFHSKPSFFKCARSFLRVRISVTLTLLSDSPYSSAICCTVR